MARAIPAELGTVPANFAFCMRTGAFYKMDFPLASLYRAYDSPSYFTNFCFSFFYFGQRPDFFCKEFIFNKIKSDHGCFLYKICKYSYRLYSGRIKNIRIFIFSFNNKVR
ncbi:hypothetical protein ACFP3I_25630 [Chryseobacterium arachidis]|uniref:hypothetical protein n=1 Tax=Chryseobacterium arachidis TaxID=1416778 RepID=UPI003606A7A5